MPGRPLLMSHQDLSLQVQISSSGFLPVYAPDSVAAAFLFLFFSFYSFNFFILFLASWHWDSALPRHGSLCHRLPGGWACETLTHCTAVQTNQLSQTAVTSLPSNLRSGKCRRVLKGIIWTILVWVVLPPTHCWDMEGSGTSCTVWLPSVAEGGVAFFFPFPPEKSTGGWTGAKTNTLCLLWTLSNHSSPFMTLTFLPAGQSTQSQFSACIV